MAASIADGANWAKLGNSMSVEDRVSIIAPHINKLIVDFENDTMRVGVQTFQEHLLAILWNALLSDERWVPVEKVGVHPDNREKAMLIPIDVHDLLLCICNSGWSWKECAGALASEIPASEMGQQWRAANQQLAEKSDGFLAPYNPDLLEILTQGQPHHCCSACLQIGMQRDSR